MESQDRGQMRQCAHAWREQIGRKGARPGSLLALVTLAAATVGFAGPAAAQTFSRKPIQVTMEGRGRFHQLVTIPVRPSVNSIQEQLSGQSELMGPFRWLSHGLIRNPAVSGENLPGIVTDGIGAMTAANGDALFFTFSGSVRMTAPDVFAGEGLFTITGGSGRFVGASGSGTFKDAVFKNKGTHTRTVDGILLLPVKT